MLIERRPLSVPSSAFTISAQPYASHARCFIVSARQQDIQDYKHGPPDGGRDVGSPFASINMAS